MGFVEKVRVVDIRYIQEKYFRPQARLIHLLFWLAAGGQPYVSLANNKMFVAIFSNLNDILAGVKSTKLNGFETKHL